MHCPNRFALRSLLALTLALAGTCGGGATPLTVQTFTSSADAIAVNSHLVVGSTEALLVDGQLFKADAASVVEMVRASGKTLKTIFLTHAHPDHYAGLAVIRDAFPAAAIVTTPEVLADFNKVAPGTFQGLKGQLGAAVADSLVTPSATTSDTLTVDGQELKILKLAGGEATVSAALLAPGIGALFAGDHLYGGVHLFIADCGTDKWQENLTTLRMVSGATRYYPGHGAAGGTEIIDADSQYIKDALPILGAGTKTADTIAALVQKFPTLGAAGLLPLSVPRYGEACGARLELPGAMFYPESLHAAADGSIYVGSMATGQVQRFAAGSTQGTALLQAGAPLKGATGVLVDDAGGFLWVCALDSLMDFTKNSLKRFKLSDGSGATTFTLSGGGANACNDMTLDNNGNLYVADSVGKIHRVLKNAAVATVWSTDPLLAPSSPMGFGADGIAFDATGNGALYVNTFSDGRLLRVPLKGDGTADAAVEITVTPKLANPDGMRLLDATHLLVVEGGAGKLSQLTISGTSATATAIQTDLDLPTSVVKVGGKYYVTEGQIGRFLGMIPTPTALPFKVRIFPAQ